MQRECLTSNTFSYYTKSRYFANTGGNNDCGGQPFKSLFDTLQASAKAAQDQSLNQDALDTYLKTNLWDKAGLGEQYLLKIQAMMHAQKMGKVENGWHILPCSYFRARKIKSYKKLGG
ncbi:MAG: hypothetical protein KAH22_11650 [Thiotrichaceae bacterium]|nr:hypothetical protein [Thiotrichaceae bacterium]